MIYICTPSKVSIYVNSKRKKLAEIKEETGCSSIINGGLFTMANFTPVCHLKVDGVVLATEEYTYWGYGWSGNDVPQMTSDPSLFDNYIACICLVRNGKAEPLIYQDAMGGSRPRTAIGTFADGRVWLYASQENKTPEQMRTLALEAGLKDAVLLDGGGSTQAIFPAGTLEAERKVHNCICVWDAETNLGADTMFKIALDAGHGINTAGKRCMKALDPNETREWWLNNRICDYIERYLQEYEGYSLLRVDDSDDGKEDVPLATRTSKANAWGADFYLSVHHNAGINGGSGGGIVVYTHPQSSKESVLWRDALYDALIQHTGLKGNRTSPKLTENYHVLRETKMPAVLLELGFMDSSTDVPIILTEKYAQNAAKGALQVLVERGRLQKKASPAPKVFYKVQIGAFSELKNAEALAKELLNKGYPVYITKA